jgi:hypothetical protein
MRDGDHHRALRLREQVALLGTSRGGQRRRGEDRGSRRDLNGLAVDELEFLERGPGSVSESCAPFTTGTDSRNRPLRVRLARSVQ